MSWRFCPVLEVRAWAWVFFLGGLAVFFGCATRKARSVSPPLVSVSKVAVLPFSNQSLDLTAPELLRRLVQKAVAERGYAAVSLEEVDLRLKDLGITQGGQLKAVEPQELGRVLEVEGLLYGEVEEFEDQNLGFFQKRSVRLRLRLLSGATGESLWEEVRDSGKTELHTSSRQARQAFAERLAARWAENLMKHPLAGPSREVVEKLMRQFPRRSG
ncbi:MAG: DUF799 family lipoprotein [Elusimicrobia bacterium]|nr:DUF799 family lipoprotein [Elusimicrobiota bacterium]